MFAGNGGPTKPDGYFLCYKLCSQAYPVFCSSVCIDNNTRMPLFCICYCQRKPKNRKWGRPGNKAEYRLSRPAEIPAHLTWGCCISEFLTLPKDHWALTANVTKGLTSAEVAPSCWSSCQQKWADVIACPTERLNSSIVGTSGLPLRSTCCSRWQQSPWLMNSAHTALTFLLQVDTPASLHTCSKKGKQTLASRLQEIIRIIKP